MKIKSLLLGSIAAAGLSTGAYAADLSVLTSLGTCDVLGISGLTIESESNCVTVTGEVAYEFSWGDYDGTALTIATGAGDTEVMDNNFTGTTDINNDWDSKVDAFLKFVATSESDFGDAKAVIKFDYDDDTNVDDEVPDPTGATGDGTLRIEEAYVSIGNGTVITAGKTGSIFNADHDESYGWLSLFNEAKVDDGVATPVTMALDDGGHVIQVVSDLGNGLSIGAGLEELNQVAAGATPAATAASGVFVGVIEYAGDPVEGHISVIGGGFLDGVIEDWAVHAGLSATVDMFKFTGAFAADDNGYWNALAAAAATFDMFTLTGSVEFIDPNSNVANNEQLGFAATAEAAVTDTISVNAGFRYFDENTSTAATETWQAALQLVAEVTETVTLTGEIGLYDTNKAAPNMDVTYGSAEVKWTPSDQFESSVKGEMNSAGAYKVTYKAKKSFE